MHHVVVNIESGQAAMLVTGPWAIPRIQESGVSYAITGIPTADVESSPFLGVQGFMISNFSEQKLLAEIFLLDYVATADVMQQIFDADPACFDRVWFKKPDAAGRVAA